MGKLTKVQVILSCDAKGCEKELDVTRDTLLECGKHAGRLGWTAIGQTSGKIFCPDCATRERL